jgi:hypothetical protein
MSRPPVRATAIGRRLIARHIQIAAALTRRLRVPTLRLAGATPRRRVRIRHRAEATLLRHLPTLLLRSHTPHQAAVTPHPAMVVEVAVEALVAVVVVVTTAAVVAAVVLMAVVVAVVVALMVEAAERRAGVEEARTAAEAVPTAAVSFAVVPDSNGKPALHRAGFLFSLTFYRWRKRYGSHCKVFHRTIYEHNSSIREVLDKGEELLARSVS